jgi:lipoprotein-anchoring transpeptidase ErfK/SrfK
MALLLSPAWVAAADPAVAPFSAWIEAESAYVHATPDLRSPAVGLLRSGDVVTVVACVPDCEAPNGWALLGPQGAIRLSLLERTEEDDTHRAISASARYFYGTVRSDGTPIFASPEKHRPMRRAKAGRVLAFRAAQPTQEEGWLETADGGFVRVDAVRLARPSAFSGVHAPTAITAFTLRRTPMWPPRGQAGPPLFLDKHAARSVSDFASDFVQTDTGLLRRRDVRLAFLRPRPQLIPEDARWVHVDLNEQVLTAYEGDQLVFTTLVSTGKKDHETPTGLFRVWMKTVHHRMSGTEPVPYEVDEVPFTQFFTRGIALHGAFWHDAFGFVVSHGCVNLSVTDAEWLFGWAPPALPEGWHAVMASLPGSTPLYVVVEKARSVPVRAAPGSAPVSLSSP